MGMASVNARRRQEIATQFDGQKERTDGEGDKIIRFREDGSERITDRECAIDASAVNAKRGRACGD